MSSSGSFTLFYPVVGEYLNVVSVIMSYKELQLLTIHTNTTSAHTGT